MSKELSPLNQTGRQHDVLEQSDERPTIIIPKWMVVTAGAMALSLTILMGALAPKSAENKDGLTSHDRVMEVVEQYRNGEKDPYTIVHTLSIGEGENIIGKATDWIEKNNPNLSSEERNLAAGTILVSAEGALEAAGVSISNLQPDTKFTLVNYKEEKDISKEEDRYFVGEIISFGEVPTEYPY